MNTTPQQVITSLMSTAAANDPEGLNDLKDYLKVPDGIEKLMNHPEIKAKANQIDAEIKAIASEKLKSLEKEIAAEKETVKEGTKPLFMKKYENCFILIKEEDKKPEAGGAGNEETFNGVPVRVYVDILTDPNASPKEKEYAAARLAAYHRMREAQGDSSPENKKKKEAAETALGMIGWMLKTQKVETIATLFAFLSTVSLATFVNHEQGLLSYIPTIAIRFVTGVSAAAIAKKFRRQYHLDVHGEENSRDQNIAAIVGFIIGAVYGVY